MRQSVSSSVASLFESIGLGDEQVKSIFVWQHNKINGPMWAVNYKVSSLPFPPFLLIYSDI